VFEFLNATTLDTRTDSIDVLDSQIATLDIAVSGPVVFDEDTGSRATTLVVTRNTPTDVPLLVTIVSSDPTEARTIATAFIPIGSTSVSVPVASIDELISDGTNIVQFTAAASGFVGDTVEVRVAAVDNVDIYDRLGDRNVKRQQGQLRIEGNTIRFPSQWGIEVEAGPVDNGTQSHPGPLRNFPTLSADRIVPGAVIVNNVVANLRSAQGGIHVSGSSSNVPASNPFVRITNNTVFGEEVLQQQTARTQADIIFMVDVSASMAPNINALKSELAQFDQRINSSIDANYGLLEFPGSVFNTDPEFLVDLMPFSQFVTQPEFVNLTDSFTGTENGSRAILEALDDPNVVPLTDFSDRRPNAVTVPIVFTDEDDDSSLADITAAQILLRQRNAVFFGIVNPDRPGPNNTSSTYEAFAQVTGGATFDIDDFLRDPTAFFISFSNAFLSSVSGAASGTAILVDNNASPTILNNIIANTASGLTDRGTGTVIGANFFQGNNLNGSVGTNAIIAQPDAQGNLPPLFVEPRLGNFYLAQGTAAIDSSLNSFQDRPNFVAVKSPLGLAESPVVAPEFDAFGQKRLDDPSQPSATGLGNDIFKDRGAIERADFNSGFARLDIPRDNDAVDRDPRGTIVWLAEPDFPNQFVVELVDDGVGINDDLITSLQFQLFQDGAMLDQGEDYFFTYNPNSNRVIFTALTTFELEHTYTILVDRSPELGIRDLAGNLLLANQTNGQIRFDILLTDEANDAPQNVIPGPQTIFEGSSIRMSNGGATLAYAMGGESLLFTERLGRTDAVVIDVIVPGPGSPLDVSVSGVGTGRATIQITLATDASGASISTTDAIVEAIQRSAIANALVTVTATANSVFVPIVSQLGPREIGGTFSFAAGAETLTFNKALSVSDRVQVELLNPNAANQSLSLSVSGIGSGLATIRILLATDANSTLTSTTDAVLMAVLDSPEAASLVTASATGTGIVEPAVGPRTTANQNPLRVGDVDAFLNRYPIPGVVYTPEDGILKVTIAADNSKHTEVVAPTPVPTEIVGSLRVAVAAEVLTFSKRLSVAELVQVEFFDPGAANQPFSLSVTGVGTGGHINGVSNTLKKHFPSLKVFAVEPSDSPVLSGGSSGPHAIQGIGAGFVPANYAGSLVDDIITVTKEEAYGMVRLAASKEGLLAGISTGASLAAVKRVLELAGPGQKIMTFAYDTGERYLSVGELFS
ncbi:MAG TPA: pyridoxal-phosphate dependent enzyme, partial [Pirellulaceae bacterium]|nr:pyridoxal-phosphate dependent enzyme [Pirellulaceae bacterium]